AATVSATRRTTTMVSDEEIAGSSYILTFLNDVENLTNAYATYLNVLVRMKDKYKLDERKNLEETKRRKEVTLDKDDEEAVLTISEQLRLWIARCYIKTAALKEKMDIETDINEIKKLYEAAIKTSVIEKEIAEKFVLKINDIFIEGVLKDLLVRSKDIYSEFLKE
ncbi:MAG: hypothetical protein ACOC80_09880, partial [Petrotogales bacterium]